MFPTLIVSPAYLDRRHPARLAGAGGLAFQRVEGAFAFCIGAYSKIAEWKAIMDRLSQIEARDGRGRRPRASDAGTIAVKVGQGDELQRRRSRRAHAVGRRDRAHAGAVASRPASACWSPGRPAPANRACSARSPDLWPPGEGAVTLPRDADVLVMPQRPYFPLGNAAPGDHLSHARRRDAGRTDSARRWPTSGLAISPAGSTRRRTGASCSPAASSSASRSRARCCASPAVLLFDEPVATLDDAAGRELYRMLIERLPRHHHHLDRPARGAARPPRAHHRNEAGGE